MPLFLLAHLSVAVGGAIIWILHLCLAPILTFGVLFRLYVGFRHPWWELA